MSVTEGNVSVVRQMRVSMDFVLLKHDLFYRPNLLVWGVHVMLVLLWSCTVFRTGHRLICNTDIELLGIIVHPFAGVWGPEFILMIDNDQLRRTRGVRVFLGCE